MISPGTTSCSRAELRCRLYTTWKAELLDLSTSPMRSQRFLSASVGRPYFHRSQEVPTSGGRHHCQRLRVGIPQRDKNRRSQETESQKPQVLKKMRGKDQEGERKLRTSARVPCCKIALEKTEEGERDLGMYLQLGVNA